jgi:hypothetical protein
MLNSRVAASVLLLTLMIAAGVRAQGAPATSGDTVWFWFATCGGPTMTLEVRLDTATMYKTSFPICRAARATSSSQGEDGRVEFWFTPRRPIVWTGYRDAPDTTRANQVIEGSLWEAGADANDLVLGVSFSTGERIVINTVHVTHPQTPDATEIAHGLSVLTYPAKARK